ncbi:hypothetical protein [Sinomonas sp. ASV322]|uniref:hypothetical protein n=1 Tax=Sinomonas sp. ASV322 TaxID=3041920 RepID=UPI0027DC7F03|nr:hypothetical protein [Sinomonas sp. ASV322]MDQ4503169.1 hypothetical protein [Sinomonas sp. ASV322]
MDIHGKPTGRRSRPDAVHAVVVHEGDWWEVTIPELELSMSTRDPEMIEAHARSLAASVLAVLPRRITVAVRYAQL